MAEEFIPHWCAVIYCDHILEDVDAVFAKGFIDRSLRIDDLNSVTTAARPEWRVEKKDDSGEVEFREFIDVQGVQELGHSGEPVFFLQPLIALREFWELFEEWKESFTDTTKETLVPLI